VFIGAMHNRVGPTVNSREMGWSDAVGLVPFVLVILVLAFYPQFALKRSELATKASVAAPTLVRVASR
jgi:NADH:ubiquinone oxidoreductase subunit 4 (subunit M)